MTTPAPQPGIMEIAPYEGGESKIAGADKVIKLSSNEGAFGPSPAAVQALTDAAANIHRYPDGHSRELRAAIAERYGLEPARIVLGAGSDEIINLLCQAYAGPGDEVLYSEHGFLMYGIYAMAAGATPVKAPETDLKADVANLLAAVTEKTRLLFLANPNNPTGTYLTADEMAALRDGLPGNVILVIDGAYAEYVVGTPGYTDGMEMVRDADNMVMTRTFSKMYGLGGARLGWGYMPEAMAAVFNRIRGPFNVSVPAQAAGLAAFNDTAFTEMSRAHNDEWLKRTQDALRQLGLFVPQDGVGNFVLTRFADEATAQAAEEHLKSCGIITRQVAGYGLPDCLRITIGKAEEMEAVIAALRDFMGADT
jgi:histidinol-phosphate aminotransferase